MSATLRKSAGQAASAFGALQHANYELLVMAGDYDAALDTLEARLETNKENDSPSYVSLDLACFWWLRFYFSEDARYRSNLRLQAILAAREKRLKVERDAIH